MTEDDIFAQALQKLDTRERAAFLDATCGGDAELRARLEQRLQAHPTRDTVALRWAAESPPTGVYTPAPDDAPAADYAITSAPRAGPQPASDAGHWVGPYRLIEPLGEGGMG